MEQCGVWRAVTTNHRSGSGWNTFGSKGGPIRFNLIPPLLRGFHDTDVVTESERKGLSADPHLVPPWKWRKRSRWAARGRLAVRHVWGHRQKPMLSFATVDA
jgi:hypothetical protein